MAVYTKENLALIGFSAVDGAQQKLYFYSEDATTAAIAAANYFCDDDADTTVDPNIGAGAFIMVTGNNGYTFGTVSSAGTLAALTAVGS